MLELEKKIIKVLKNVYDPEIPVNIYDLGLIYEVKIDEDKTVNIKMTLTAPNCPMADTMIDDVYQGVKAIDDIKDVKIQLVFEPAWDKSMMSEEARVELGFD